MYLGRTGGGGAGGCIGGRVGHASPMAEMMTLYWAGCGLWKGRSGKQGQADGGGGGGARG